MKYYWIVILAWMSWAEASEFKFKDGDRVVLVGNTFMERAQKYGHLETALTLAGGAEELSFRNLAWSGDTVFGDARSYFGPPAEGFSRLRSDLTRIKPTVVVICYGAVAAFEKEAGQQNFINGYVRLIEMIEAAADPREVILVSPPPAETLPPPMPDMTAHNKSLAVYRDAILLLTEKKKLRFADLFEVMGGESSGLTYNGLHFANEGYAQVAPKLLQAMGLEEAKVGLEEREILREKIIAKNKKVFQQWRPANETYLRLFRKYEQGQNAKELDDFDDMIASLEAEIEKLKGEMIEISK